jgi:hypothetical protein
MRQAIRDLQSQIERLLSGGSQETQRSEEP